MEIILYSIIILAGLFILVLAIALCLPSKKKHTKQIIYNASPKAVFNIVTDNANWQHRTDLVDLKIISIDGYIQIWEEYTTNKQVVRFKTRDFVPYSFYSFDMESKYFNGYWTSEYKKTEDGATLFTATEYIKCKTLFVRIMHRLFFDMDKYMTQQQQYIQSKLDEMDSQAK